MSEYRGRGSRSRGGRGGLLRGGSRNGGYSERESGRGRGRGDGFSRGRGGPPPRHLSRDDSPPRKVALMSRGYESERGRRPPMDRRLDRYEDGFERGPPARSRELYSSPPRESGRLMDRMTSPRGSLRERDHGMSSRGDGEYPSSRGDFLSPRSYSPPLRDSGSFRESYGSGLREERRDVFSRPGLREYTSQRSGERSREIRESPREYGGSREYPPSRGGEFRESMGGRGDFREREFTSSRLMSRPEGRGPPSREYVGRGIPRGAMRGGREDRGSRGIINGSRGRGGPPRVRGRPEFSGSRRSPISSRDGPLGKRPRMEVPDGYRR